MMYHRTCAAVAAVMVTGWTFTACGAGPKTSSNRDLEAVDASDAWEGLLRPLDVATDHQGRVYVADAGDFTVKVFDADGHRVQSFGREGIGPGEFKSIQNIVVLGDTLVAFDAKLRRLALWRSTGAFLRFIVMEGGEDYIGGLGTDRILLSGSPEWSLPAPSGRAWPLLRIMNIEGDSTIDIGGRRSYGNPFVNHIRNFVIPVGTPDGEWIWMPYLNDTVIHLVSVSTGETRIIPRGSAFEWQRLPEDFAPEKSYARPGKNSIPPFDVVTLDAAVDAMGRLYALTALESSRNEDGVPGRVAVDVLEVQDTAYTTLHVPAPATHIAVSPTGDHVYLLDSHTAKLYHYRRMLND